MAANITYGTGIPGDAELRLCGDVSDAKRAVELGVSEWFNSLVFAVEGAICLIMAIYVLRWRRRTPRLLIGATYLALWFYAMSVGLGYALFYCLPRGYALAGFGFTESMLLAFAAINIHHFIVDAFIWRVRRDRRNLRIVERGGLAAPEAPAPV